MRNARSYAASITTAGALFIGVYTPEPAGDYFAGPNHVLPTGGSARFASPLGVADFVKRTSIIEYQARRSAQADDIERLAEVEGLSGHARAVVRARAGRPAADARRWPRPACPFRALCLLTLRTVG